MTCKEISALLSSYVDNELSINEMNLVNEHIASCSMCQQEVNELKELQKVLSSLEDVPVPVEFDTRLHEALVIEAEKMRSSKIVPFGQRKFKNWRRISSIAAVFIVGLFSVILYNNNSDDFNQQELILDNMEAQKLSSDEANPKQRLAPISEDTEMENTQLTDEEKTKDTNSKKQESKQSTDVAQVPEMASSRDANIDANLKSAPIVYENPAPEEPKEEMSASENNENGISNPINETDEGTYQIEPRGNATNLEHELQVYLNFLNEILIDKHYEVNSYTMDQQTGIMTIEIVIITTNADGSETKENAVYCGQDGKLWKKEL
ncbi:MAG: anti-sigma factor family protein [Aminipila sp.]